MYLLDLQCKFFILLKTIEQYLNVILNYSFADSLEKDVTRKSTCVYLNHVPMVFVLIICLTTNVFAILDGPAKIVT